MKNTLQQFQTDYIISWDFSKEDSPCVTVGQLRRDEENKHLVMDLLGCNFARSGCISLRQIIEDYEAEKRREAERKMNAEALRRTFRKEAEERQPEEEGKEADQ